jgi:benzil reductase ((S)-benzoin forming)
VKNGFFLITGTSKGIGEALAQNLLEKGHTVLGISRSISEKLKFTKYYHLVYDLTDTSHFSQVMEKVSEIVAQQSFDFICLVNNASALEPFGPIEKCPAAKIDTHVRIGLIAPMVLTSMFIRKFYNDKTRKKVVFISSGAAFAASAEDSIYCSSKAGLHMFAKCVGLEQQNREYGFEVVSIGPGMVDTPMQLAARSVTIEEYSGVDFFIQAYKDGKLQKPELVAEKIYTILENKYEQGKYVSVSEV